MAYGKERDKEVMSKAILVIDMPESCNKCKLKTHRFGFTTNKMKVGCKFKGDILTDVLSDRPNWCPLKPMPEKRILPTWQTMGMPKGNEPWFTEGYNNCIDEILGEEK